MYIDRVNAPTDLTDLIAAIRLDPEFGATANACYPDYELAIQIARAGAITHAAAIEVGRRLAARIQQSYRW